MVCDYHFSSKLPYHTYPRMRSFEEMVLVTYNESPPPSPEVKSRCLVRDFVNFKYFFCIGTRPVVPDDSPYSARSFPRLQKYGIEGCDTYITSPYWTSKFIEIPQLITPLCKAEGGKNRDVFFSSMGFLSYLLGDALKLRRLCRTHSPYRYPNDRRESSAAENRPILFQCCCPTSYRPASPQLVSRAPVLYQHA